MAEPFLLRLLVRKWEGGGVVPGVLRSDDGHQQIRLRYSICVVVLFAVFVYLAEVGITKDISR